MTVTYRLYVLAGRAAIALRDPDRARRALADLDAVGVHGRWAAASRTSIEAGVLALDGRLAEALAGYAEALRVWRALDLPFEVALTDLELVELVGLDNREARAAADEARAIATQLGAIGLVRRLDRVGLRDGGSTPPESAAKVAGQSEAASPVR